MKSDVFIQKILREVHCPRCNAIAQERLEDKGKFVLIYLWCNKCKLKRNMGLTTRRALKLKKRRSELRDSLNQAKSQRVRSRILKQLELLERRIRQAELGL